MPETLRFALLHHTGHPEKQDHYDLLLETETDCGEDAQTVLAFATVCDRVPTGDADGDLLIALPDHRRFYLTHEGPVSGNRGNVTRIDEGAIIFSNGFKTPVSFRLFGRKLKGAFSIQSHDGKHLLFLKEVVITTIAPTTQIG